MKPARQTDSLADSSKDNEIADTTYESELKVVPPGKILSMAIAYGSLFGVHHAIWGSSMSWPLRMSLSVSSLSISLAVRMSAFRTEMIYLGNDKVITNTKRFAGFSRAQLNNLEYAPLIAALGFFREYQRATLGVPLSGFGTLACQLALFGCWGYVITVSSITGDNAYGPKGNALDRFLSNWVGATQIGRSSSAIARYIGVIMLLLDIASAAK